MKYRLQKHQAISQHLLPSYNNNSTPLRGLSSTNSEINQFDSAVRELMWTAEAAINTVSRTLIKDIAVTK